MSVGTIVRSIDEALDKYQEFLKQVSEEEFQQTPAEGAWSYSEVYAHVMKADLGSLIAIERCIHAKKPTPDGMNIMAWAILFFGRMPPTAPDRVNGNVAKISKEEASNLIFKVRNKVHELLPRVAKTPRHNKINHPRLGLLNARQWLRFVEIHTLHHLKQLQRISKILGNN